MDWLRPKIFGRALNLGFGRVVALADSNQFVMARVVGFVIS
jgi:hypothetical protein